MILVIGVSLFLFGFFVLRMYGITRDDAFIYYRYVYNVASGYGPVFNAGAHVEGFTSPLWLIALTVVARFLSVETASKVSGVACTLLTASILARWLLQKKNSIILESRERLLVVCITTLLLLGDIAVSYYSVVGLDTTLTLLVFTSAALSLYDYIYAGKGRLAPLLVGLTVWARPEGFLFVGCALTLIIIKTSGDRLKLFVFWSTVVVILLLVLRYVIYGEFLPNTYYAKARFTPATLGDAATYLGVLLYHYGKPVYILLAIIGMGRILHGKLALLIPVFCSLGLVILSGGDWMPLERFLVPTYGIVALLGGIGFVVLLRDLNSILQKALLLGFLVLSICAASFVSTRGLFESGFTFSGPEAIWSGGSIGQPNPHQVEVSYWIKHNVANGKTVAYGDMGRTPFENLSINFLDYYGLVNHDVARLTGVHRRASGVNEDELDDSGPLGRCIKAANPDYLISKPRKLDWMPGERIWNGKYEMVAVLGRKGDSGTVVFRRVNQ